MASVTKREQFNGSTKIANNPSQSPTKMEISLESHTTIQLKSGGLKSASLTLGESNYGSNLKKIKLVAIHFLFDKAPEMTYEEQFKTYPNQRIANTYKKL